MKLLQQGGTCNSHASQPLSQWLSQHPNSTPHAAHQHAAHMIACLQCAAARLNSNCITKPDPEGRKARTQSAQQGYTGAAPYLLCPGVSQGSCPAAHTAEVRLRLRCMPQHATRTCAGARGCRQHLQHTRRENNANIIPQSSTHQPGV
jgi:hypothetical protein